MPNAAHCSAETVPPSRPAGMHKTVHVGLMHNPRSPHVLWMKQVLKYLALVKI